MNRCTIEQVAYVFFGEADRVKLNLDGGVRVIIPSDFKPKLTPDQYYVEDSISIRRLERVKSGDILISLVGDIGSSMVADDIIAGSVLGRGCAALRLREDAQIVTNDWIKAWVLSTDFKEQVSEWVVGDVLSRLPGSALRGFSLPEPSPHDLVKLESLNGPLAKTERELHHVLRLIRDLRKIENELLFCRG